MKRLLFRTSLLVALAHCCAAGLGAQEPCRLERAVAPDYGGVMLGMRPEELARMFPGSEELRAGPRGEEAAKPFVVSLGMLELSIRKEEFRGVGELVLTFEGGNLRRMDVRFRQPTPWKAIAAFSEHTSRRLALPADSWGEPASDGSKQARALVCRGFGVVVSMEEDGKSTLSIVDTAAATAAAEPAPPPRRTPARRGGTGPKRGAKGKGSGQT